MRKNVITFSAVLLAFASLVSCGDSMTEEQIQAEAKKQFDEKQTELAEQAVTDCDENKAVYMQSALDSIKTANEM